jgi:myo-inositol 2-dehydrogenase / D-chiro-inositol 1-dehydrogenase
VSDGRDRLRVGLVGAGVMGATHLAGWMAEGNPVTVFDVDPERAAALAADPGAGVARDLDELLERSDVVDVCTATHRHAEVAIAAARAGRHVICEKPLARTIEDAEAMIDACATAGVRLFVAQVVRFFPEYAAARAAVVDGAIGEPAVLRLKRASYRPRQQPGHWFFDVSKSGGMVVDLMIHDLDYARWVAGEVTSVSCRSAGVERPHLGVDHAVAILTHASGAISQVTGSWAYAPPTFRTAFEIAGSTGLIEHDSAASPPIVTYLRPAGTDGGPVGMPGSPVAVDPYRLELREFHRAVLDGTTARVDAADGLAALRIALAADESARTGRVVRLGGGGAR